MTKLKDITGHKFGKLTALEIDSKVINRIHWVCECECGKIKSIRSSHLTMGKIKTCGCVFGDHGMAGTTQYAAWRTMKSRCQNPNATEYQRYGARGIEICERWNRFENFLADMGPRPPGASIDRINNNGNYEPANCRWSTPKEQANNRISNVSVTAFYRTMNLEQWSNLLGWHPDTIGKVHRREDFEFYIIKKKGIRYVCNEFFSRRSRTKTTTT